ncbi:MAG: hypothetical protein PHY34_01065 [Patescibacteria group bacterium]|nr:hypothetical protein [Patescibacteria group bacterium]MDD5715188.1 hypothetical protein [Patescibacteria group bacterium]
MNLKVFMNRLGYHQQSTRDPRSFVFIRRLRGLPFPRFHLYVYLSPERTEFNLHLDEKQPSYEGSPAHAGEYDSELVVQERDRMLAHLNAPRGVINS